MSTAGPAGWKPPLAVGLPSVRSSFPFESKTRMSGVNGFFGSKSPLPKSDWLLHRLGRPCPDSSTYTSKFSLLPRNAIPVGKLRPALKTETLKPGGTMMSLPESGSKSAVLFVHSGLATVAAEATAGIATIGAKASTEDRPEKKQFFIAALSALPETH